MKRTAVGVAGLASLAAGWVALASTRPKPAVTGRFGRSVKVWKLSARNSARYAVMRVRGAGSPAQRRAELDEQFAIRTAADVANELGQMKGVLMKAGQMVSFVLESLPEEAQSALATLQSGAEPMAPSLAAEMVRNEFGADPDRVFLDWDDLPAAAASIGQVHRAVAADGESVAVKVQYPGVREAIDADLEAADVMYAMFSQMMLKGLDTKALVNELRGRLRDELDYELEARSIAEFGELFAGHPWVRVPRLRPDLSGARVLTTEWSDGMAFDEFRRVSTPETRQRAAEVIWRFAQLAIHRHGVFNGDPHPGNYLFHHDGSVTFLDFGLTKRWALGEWESLRPTLDAAIIGRDPQRTLDAMETAGFIAPGSGLDPQLVFDYVSSPYQPYLADHFRFGRSWMIETLQRTFDVDGPHAAVIRAINIPPSFVMLNRVVWGINAILSKLDAEGPFRAMLLEYMADAEPATEIGVAEAGWRMAATR